MRDSVNGNTVEKAGGWQTWRTDKWSMGPFSICQKKSTESHKKITEPK